MNEFTHKQRIKERERENIDGGEVKTTISSNYGTCSATVIRNPVAEPTNRVKSNDTHEGKVGETSVFIQGDANVIHLQPEEKMKLNEALKLCDERIHFPICRFSPTKRAVFSRSAITIPA